jgi:hypothetical protein
MDLLRLDRSLMKDNLDHLVIFMNFIYLYLCIYVYADVIVDITPQPITHNQRSKSNKYHKNKQSSV